MRAPRDWYPPIAETQYGAFTRAQALAAGATPREIYQRIRTGRWVLAAGRAFRTSSCPPIPQLLVTAVHLTWPDAIVCGPLAAAMNGAPVDLARDLPVWVPEFRRTTHRLVPRRFAIDQAQVAQWGTVPITRRQESLIETLGWLPYDDARDLFAWGVTRRRIDLETLERAIGSRSPRWGVGQLRRLLADSEGGALSEAEVKLHEILRAAGVTGWVANASVLAAGHTYWVDVLFKEAMVAVDVDGAKAHGPERRQHDMTRRNNLERAGFRTCSFTWADVARRPGYVLATIDDLRGRPRR